MVTLPASEQRLGEIRCKLKKDDPLKVVMGEKSADQRLDEIRCKLKKDNTLKVVMQYVQEGWPTDKRKLE